MIIEEVLGVDKETIIEDYMRTNVYLEQDMLDYIEKMAPIATREAVEQPVRDFFGAREEYIAATINKIDTEFGGMWNFLRNKLGVDETLENKLKAMYLE